MKSTANLEGYSLLYNGPWQGGGYNRSSAKRGSPSPRKQVSYLHTWCFAQSKKFPFLQAQQFHFPEKPSVHQRVWSDLYDTCSQGRSRLTQHLLCQYLRLKDKCFFFALLCKWIPHSIVIIVMHFVVTWKISIRKMVVQQTKRLCDTHSDFFHRVTSTRVVWQAHRLCDNHKLCKWAVYIYALGRLCDEPNIKKQNFPLITPWVTQQ